MNMPRCGVVGLAGSLGCPDDPENAVIDLYRVHVLGLTRLAVVLLGDRPAAEAVVQDAFCGLYTHWGRLAEPAKALPYLRSWVPNGCRRHGRRRFRAGGGPSGLGPAPCGRRAVARRP